jgi:hypothetical protein
LYDGVAVGSTGSKGARSRFQQYGERVPVADAALRRPTCLSLRLQTGMVSGVVFLTQETQTVNQFFMLSSQRQKKCPVLLFLVILAVLVLPVGLRFVVIVDSK